MAPIYTAKNNGPKDITPPLFAIKGVPNKTPVQPSLLNLYGLPLFLETAYALYRSFIAAFVCATSRQIKITANSSAFPSFSPRGKLPIQVPGVSFSLRKPMSPDKAATFARKLVNGSVEYRGQTQIFHCDRVPDDILREFVIPFHNPEFNPTNQNVTPSGLEFFDFVTGTIFEFLATHTYPAFRSTPTKNPDQYPVEQRSIYAKNAVPMKYVEYKKDTHQPSLWSSYSLLHLHPTPAHGSSMDIDGGSVVTSTDVMSQPMDTSPENTNGFMTFTSNDSIVCAKPSPGRADNNYGLTTKIPDLPGLVFPYFDGLIRPDPAMFLGDFVSLFFRLFGSDVAACEEKHRKFRRGVQSLGRSVVGMALTHIMMMVKIALDTQTRLFVVLEDGVYKGSVILGSGFKVFDGASWKEPVTSLTEDLEFLDPTLRSIREIARMLSNLKLEGSYSGPDFTKDFIETPNKLVSVFSGFSFDSIGAETIAKLDSLFQGLNLRGAGFEAMNPQNVLKFVESFFSDEPAIIQRPTYIPSIRSPIESKSFVLLSRFGPEAPSFWNEKGSEITVAAASSGSGKRKRDDEELYGYMPKEFHIIPKPLHIAHRDFHKVLQKGAVKMDLKERARGFRTIGLIKETAIKPIWKALVEGLENHSGDEVVVAKKRKVDAPLPDYDDVLAKFL